MNRAGKAELILVNGHVVTLNRKDETAQAVAVRGGRIAAIGSNRDIEALAGKETQRIDLEGKTVTPGFVESHCHPPDAGIKLRYEIDLRSATSIDEVIATVERKAQKLPRGEWLRGFGYNDRNLKEQRHPTRWDLDKAAGDHPAFLGRTDGHLGVANSLALKQAQVSKDTPDPDGGRFDRDPRTREPNGVLRENAMNPIVALIPPYSREQTKAGIVTACGQLAQWGITSAHDAWVGHGSLTAYQELLSENELPLRIGMMIVGIPVLEQTGYLYEMRALGIKAGFGNERLRLLGTKFMCDGSMSGWTAALHDPYANDPAEYGITVCGEEELTAGIVAAHRAGLRPMTHAIGDRAIDLVLDAIEKGLQERPDADHRMTVEHCSIPSAGAIERIKRLGVLPSSSAGFICELGAAHMLGIGPQRMKQYFPHRTYLQEGIIAVGNSDWPVTSGNIAQQLHGLVTRKCDTGEKANPEQSISIKDAVRLYTVNGAYASFEEHLKGSLEPGKLADMAALDRDIFSIPADEIKEMTVAMTIVGGEVVYRQ